MPHEAHSSEREWPHSPQNFRPASLALPQLPQFKWTSRAASYGFDSVPGFGRPVVADMPDTQDRSTRGRHSACGVRTSEIRTLRAANPGIASSPGGAGERRAQCQDESSPQDSVSSSSPR